MKNISNSQFYQNAIDEFGVSAQGVHWNSKYSQYKRFEIITKLIRKDIKNSTLVDVGCGFGEYYNYLDINSRAPMEFIGVDCEEQMIAISKKRFPNQTFLKQDVLTDKLILADYYTSSGALNILNYEQCDLFIQKCFDASKKGFIFNFLKNLTFNDVSKEDILGICKKYTNTIKIREYYLDNDFTIYMVKP